VRNALKLLGNKNHGDSPHQERKGGGGLPFLVGRKESVTSQEGRRERTRLGPGRKIAAPGQTGKRKRKAVQPQLTASGKKQEKEEFPMGEPKGLNRSAEREKKIKKHLALSTTTDIPSPG